MSRISVKRLLALVLAVAILIAMNASPAAVWAAETRQPTLITASATKINPLYAGGQVPDTDGVDAQSAEHFYADSADEAAEELRYALMHRETAIVLSFPVDIPLDMNNQNAFWEALWELEEEIYQDAVAHTGKPWEGDYLRYNIYGRSMNVSVSPCETIEVEMTYTFTYNATAQQENQVDAAVDTLLAELNVGSATDYEKVCAVYDWLCENVTYSETIVNDNSPIYSAYGALVEKDCVCQGYATAMYRLLLELDVDCRVIAGTSHGENHAWNIVKLGSRWYNADATWDAPCAQWDMAYEWFLKCPANFPDHTREAEFTTESFHAAHPMADADFDPNQVLPEPEPDYIAKGTCGDNLTWVLGKDEVLTISGTGAMYNYSDDNLPPWEAWKDSVMRVVLENGVTTIGNHAFVEYSCLTRISIPESVTSIGHYAFAGSYQLNDVVLPKKLESLGQYAFQLTDLKSIAIPEGITKIEAGVFDYCRSLTSVMLPDTVTQIDRGAFSSCNQLTEIKLPENLQIIGQKAFIECFSLPVMVIPASVKTIGDSAFSICDGLQEVRFLGDAPAMNTDGYVFDCVETDVYYPAGNATYTAAVKQNYGGKLTWIPYGEVEPDYIAKGTCGDNLTWVLGKDEVLTISGTGAMYDYDYSNKNDAPWGDFWESIMRVIIKSGVTSIGSYAFCFCSNLTEIEISDGVTEVGADAFSGCDSLTKITLPTSVTSIGDGAFSICGSLTEITIPEGVTSIGSAMFDSCENLKEITLPASVTSIEGFAFVKCESLKKITLPDNLATIGHYAFYSCKSLTEIMFPKGLTSIDHNAFDDCVSLQAIIFTGDMPVMNPDHDRFSGVTATVYYPAGNATYTDAVKRNYGGELTWVPYGEVEPDYIAKGVCGDNLTWGLEENGTLTISGTGAMHEYPAGNPAPWYDLRDSVKRVIIENGATNISERAFVECRNMVEITLPDTLTHIGYEAFAFCESLKEILIPEGVTEIRSWAFVHCYNLEKITIPNTVASIGKAVFVYCNSMTEITIPDSVTSMDERVFSNCPSLVKVKLSENLTGIGNETFAYCDSLTEITIPKGVTSIGQAIFKGSPNLSSITVAAENPVYHSDGNCLIETASKTLVAGCKTSAIPADGSVTAIGNGAFGGCNGLTEIVIPQGVTAIGDEAFLECINLTKVTISASVTDIGEAVFQDAYGISQITVADGNPVYHSDGNCLIETASKTLVAGCKTSVIPADGSVTAIGAAAFRGCSGLTEITIPKGVTSIGKTAFSWCSGLTEITIPKSVTKISRMAFMGCDALQTVYFEGDAPKEGIESDAFFQVEATVYYPNGNTTYTDTVKQDYAGTLTWEPYGEAEPDYLFKGTCGDDLTWGLTADGTLIISGTGAMYDYTSESPAPWHSVRSDVKHVIIESGVTGVGNYAFYWCDQLTDVTIPEGVTAIGDNAFKMCPSLKEIIIPEGATRIGEYAFDSCDQMTAAVIPDSVTSIGAYAFTNCGNLTEVAIPDHITQIPDGLFNRCAHLPNITIPAGVTAIGKNAFSDCDGITSIVIPEGVTVIEGATFSNCDNLTQITIPAGVTAVGRDAFFGCVNLTGIVLPEGVTSIGDGAFGSCIRLAEIVIPSGVTAIGEGTFCECESLKEIAIPEGVTSIGYGAFRYCRALEQITIPGSVTDIAMRAFEGCSNLTKATLLEGVTTVSNFMFYQCEKLAEVTIPESVTSIGDNAFEYCTGLTAINIPMGVKTIGGSAFANCENLTEVAFAEGLKVIGGIAFSNCTSLVNVTFPKSLQEIGGNAFEYCSKLEKLWFQGDAPTIGYDAFRAVKANGFYPANGVGWDAAVNEFYGGTITWASYAEGEETFAFTGTSVSLGDSLDIHFFLSDYEVESTDYAVITRSYADGREDHVVTVPYADWNALGDGRLYITYHDIAAKEMNDVLSVVVYDAEGNEISQVYTDSIKSYAMRLLHSITIDGAPQILLVDMLNYGAEAQRYFGYDTEHLANAELTLAEQGFASDDYLAENKLSCSEGRAATAITLKSRLSLDLYFKNSVIGSDYSDRYAIVTYTDHYGKTVEYRVEGKDFVATEGDRGYVSVTGLAIADYRQLVTCTVYDSEGNSLAWTTDSVEGYIARMDDQIPDIVGALAKLGNIAHYYFHTYLEFTGDALDFPQSVR